MAVTAAALESWETASFDLDKPILGAQVIPVAPTTELWKSLAGADITDSDYPVHRVHDDDPDLPSTDSVSLNNHYLTFDFGEEVELDFVAIVGHNFGTLGVGTLNLEISTSGGLAFTTKHTCEIDSSITSDDRIMQLDLHHTGSVPLRYGGVQYVRVHVYDGGSAVDSPEINELVIGRRRQLKHYPALPYNPQNWETIADIGETKGGSIDKTVYASNRFVLDSNHIAHETDRIADVNDWFKQVKGSFVWIQNPSTAPASFHLMMRDEDRHGFPLEGWAKRTAHIHGIECGPEAWYLANE